MAPTGESGRHEARVNVPLSSEALVIRGMSNQKCESPDDRTSNPLRRRGRLRADDGNLESTRGRDLPRLAGAAPGLALDRRRMRQRRLHRAAGRALRAKRSPGDRSVGGATRLCARTARDTRGGVPPRRRHGAFLRRTQVRCRRHGAGDLLRSRSGQMRRRDGAGRLPGRHGRELRVGRAGRRTSSRTIQAEMRAMGLTTLRPPSSDASRMESLRDLWTGSALEEVETREIVVQRTFADFGHFWTTSLMGSGIGQAIAAMAPGDAKLLAARVRARLPADEAGRITYGARANAIKGRVPGNRAKGILHAPRYRENSPRW